MKENSYYFGLKAIIGYLFCINVYEVFISYLRSISYDSKMSLEMMIILATIIITCLVLIFIKFYKSSVTNVILIISIVIIASMPFVGKLLNELSGEKMPVGNVKAVIENESNLSITSFYGSILIPLVIIGFLFIKTNLIKRKSE